MRPVRPGYRLNGRYQLTRPLGRGSMGQVWEAVDLRLERPVAVKFLAAELLREPDQRARAERRFQREAKAAAAVDHANVATVHDADIDDDGCWMTMQLVRGATLGDLVDERGPIGRDEVVSVGAQLCAGLAAVHAAGLVHRDLKPTNVLVGADGVLRIVDFGLVLPMDAGATRLTATGEYPGTADYTAPEVFTGEREADARSDLYGVGCLLYHLLAGEPPFGDTGGPVGLVLKARLAGPPSLEAGGVDVPVALGRLVTRLLSPVPEQRPESAAEVYHSLRPFLPEPVRADLAGPAMVAEDARRPFRYPMAPPPPESAGRRAF